MRSILSLLAIGTLAIFIACQTASSTTTADSKSETKAEKEDTGHDRDDRKAEKSESHANDDGHSHDEDEVARVTLDEAKEAFDNGEALFLDTRSKNAYQNEHIKGAIHIPAGELEERYKEIPRGKTIITYCS